MNILILEDSEERIKIFKKILNNNVLFITKYEDKFFDYIENNEIDFIFFDHDLGIDLKIGAEISKELVDKYMNDEIKLNTVFIIHSNNPPGSKNIISDLKLLNKYKNKNFEIKYYTFGSEDFYKYCKLIN